MTMLQALDRYYVRMAARGEAEAPGYSREKIGFAIVLSAEGAPIEVLDLREQQGKRLQPRQLEVPAAPKRTVAIVPNLLWDKTSYVLGGTDEMKWRPERIARERQRLAEEHAAFRALHRDLLAHAGDAGLLALRRFLEAWTPERFGSPPFRLEMLDANLVFRLDGDNRFVHERDAAQRL